MLVDFDSFYSISHWASPPLLGIQPIQLYRDEFGLLAIRLAREESWLNSVFLAALSCLLQVMLLSISFSSDLTSLPTKLSKSSTKKLCSSMNNKILGLKAKLLIIPWCLLNYHLSLMGM